MTMREGSGPVEPEFLDRTGRRRRLFLAAGAAGGLLLFLLLVALVAGFTGAAPGSLPGFPRGDDQLRIDHPDTAVSARPRTTPRQTPATTTAARPASGAADRTATTAVSTAATSVSPTATPTTSVNPHRRVPTHTPKPHKSKDR